MKLINCTTLRIEDFVGSSIPQRYAILSHRWEADEVTYQEVVQGQDLDRKAGWAKVREACRVALSKDCKYAWVDTCCINKQDFTELTEAINSMFKWYANAAACLAYLSDIAPGQSFIEHSLWFTRGWTLQELIAPKVVEFYDAKWNPIGTRENHCDVIHLHTRIDKKILLHEASSNRTLEGLLAEVPLARRMSWASRRTTTREEDVAYSLLGIFGINMPLLYGEGQNAFVRLQTEIIRETNDMTLFGWTCNSEDPGQQAAPEYRGILAASPREFARASNYVLTRDIKYNPEYTMTNKGLRIVAEISMGGNMMQFLTLGCHQDGCDSGKSLGIPLEDHGGGTFLRSHPSKIYEVKEEALRQTMTLYIKKHMNTEAVPSIVAADNQSFRAAYQFHLDPRKIEQVSVVPANMWNQQKRMFVTKGLDVFDGFVQFRMAREGITHDFVVACGFTSQDGEWICIASMTGKNRYIYSAAINGDLKRMRTLGIRANQKSVVRAGRFGGAVARMQIRHRAGELLLHIYLDEDYASGCLTM